MKRLLWLAPLLAACRRDPPIPPPWMAVAAAAPAVLADDFDAAALAPHWTPVRSGDARDPEAAPRDGRLALALDTLGADPRTPKVVGLRTRDAHPVGAVEWTLDWNAQANGSYLQAALYVSPHATEGDPAGLPDWIRVEHVGVPPGTSWRHAVAEQRDGRLRFLDEAGWPADRAGRPPGAPRARLARLPDGRLEYAEDGVVRSTVTPDLPLDGPLYVYFTLTGHSNYPRRTVYVDAVRLSPPSR